MLSHIGTIDNRVVVGLLFLLRYHLAFPYHLHFVRYYQLRPGHIVHPNFLFHIGSDQIQSIPLMFCNLNKVSIRWRKIIFLIFQ